MKKWLIIAIIALIVIAFIFPKDAGQTGMPGMMAPGGSWTDKECSCIGLKYHAPLMIESRVTNLCAGIVSSCKCIEHTINTTKEVEC